MLNVSSCGNTSHPIIFVITNNIIALIAPDVFCVKYCAITVSTNPAITGDMIIHILNPNTARLSSTHTYTDSIPTSVPIIIASTWICNP